LYVGKTEGNLYQRCREHATTKESAVNDHFVNCQQLNYLLNVFMINLDEFNPCEIMINFVNKNTTIIDTSNDWNTLLIKEALYINMKSLL